jgi:hypothetical protein
VASALVALSLTAGNGIEPDCRKLEGFAHSQKIPGFNGQQIATQYDVSAQYTSVSYPHAAS